MFYMTYYVVQYILLLSTPHTGHRPTRTMHRTILNTYSMITTELILNSKAARAKAYFKLNFERQHARSTTPFRTTHLTPGKLRAPPTNYQATTPAAHCFCPGCLWQQGGEERGKGRRGKEGRGGASHPSI
jgi:hypothetical protein